ncbi:MAG: hypothetical protein MJ237_07820 [bacterium]|nr:hypothetical protein [bacterium]
MKLYSTQNPYNQNFTSRNAEIRFADQIARTVQKNYPCLSDTKYARFHTYSPKTEHYLDNLVKKRKILRRILHNNTQNFISISLFQIFRFTNKIKSMGVGNCGEVVILAALVAKVNGIKDFCVTEMHSSETDVYLDHAILFVNAEKKYIIDSLLGFADYLANAEEKYKGVYSHCFDWNGSEQEEIYLYEASAYSDNYENAIKKVPTPILRMFYPELIIKK